MKKRILITNGHLNVGGVEKSLINLLNSIDYEKYEVDLLLFEGLGDYLDDIPEQVRIINCDLRDTYGPVGSVIKNNVIRPKVIYQKLILTAANKINLGFLKCLRVSDKYDIAIAYRMDLPLYYASYGVKAKKKYFWWHNGVFDYTERTLELWRKAAIRMDGIVFVSEPIRKMIEPYFTSYVNQTFVIPNSINCDEIIIKAGNRNPFNTDTANIVSVGRFSSEKHMADCVHVAEKLIERGINDFHWYLIGDGPQWDEINHLILSKRLTEYITCTGRRSNPYPYLKYADLFVHPSYVESQGIIVLEAMILEKLVVCVESDGVMTFAENGFNALTAEKDIDKLTDSVAKALALEPDRINEMQANAVKTAKEYSSGVIWKLIEKQLLEDN